MPKATTGGDALPLAEVRDAIIADPSNRWAAELGYLPLYAASAAARIVIIGQAPGRRAQESGIPWDDPSGVRLRSWLGVDDEVFYDPASIALLPMDFYFPGKGSHGDLPPRKDFAPRWHPAILGQLPEVRLTVLIGSHAQAHYLGSQARSNLTETVRAHIDYAPAVIPLVHPSPLNFRWQKANPWFEADVVPALQDLVRAALT
ncbi:uracil-DNA glycosylase family protein [Kribbella sp. NBC_01505]|uniref:uracil-DNA glycosylase family protein n=1 Tax=Kribbella sp. NBC_01505 TaxID=2903580 RepID=UPI0038661F63